MFLQFPKRFVLENDPPFNHVSVPRARPGSFGGAKGPRNMGRVSNEQALQVARAVVSGAATVLLDAPSRCLKVGPSRVLASGLARAGGPVPWADPRACRVSTRRWSLQTCFATASARPHS